jgi:hypothetical protein
VNSPSCEWCGYETVSRPALQNDGGLARLRRAIGLCVGSIQKEAKKNEMKSGSQHDSVFNRMFPVPKGADGSNAKINLKGHKIVIKFPKK